MTRLLWVKRKSVAAVVICAVLAAASFAYWQMNQSAQAAMVYPHPGLVGWWRFDEGSGTVAGDSSGYGNNGTINGVTWVDGKYGKALSFEGENDYVALAVPIDSTKTYSFSAWINPSSVSQIMMIMSQVSGGFMFGIVGNNFVNWVDTDALPNFVPIGASLLNTWTNLIWITNLTSGVTNLYVNGSFVGSGNATVFAPDNSNLASIGRYDSGSFYWNGTIDEVRVFNRALSPTEIQESSQKSPDFSSKLLATIPKGTTQAIVTLSWQGVKSINVTVLSPSKNYTEDLVPVYQKTVYSTSSGTSGMLNIKRLSISVNALSSDENWYIVLESDGANAYQITVEVQK